VLEAIRQGFEVFGLSEHAPRYRIEDLFPEEVSPARRRSNPSVSMPTGALAHLLNT
jgi:histidinol phosphatase-like PHP family hydrolase